MTDSDVIERFRLYRARAEWLVQELKEQSVRKKHCEKLQKAIVVRIELQNLNAIDNQLQM